MANVEHSTLTGASLHESKGVAAAAANRVHVTDGAGSGSYTLVPITALALTAKAFQAQLLHIRQELASNTQDTTVVNATWSSKAINTVVTNEISSASLASNEISLPAGTYFIDATIPMYNSVFQTRLRNITDGSDVFLGTSEYCSLTNTRSHLRGRFTLAGTKSLAIQAYVSGGNNWANPANNGSVEVYTDAMIWKIA